MQILQRIDKEVKNTTPEKSKLVSNIIDTESLLSEFKLKWTHPVVGIDPGSRHMGFTLILQDRTICTEILLPQSKDPIERMVNIEKVLCELEKIPLHAQNPCTLCIEGASHAEKFGQVQLAEARARAMIFFQEMGDKVIVVAPSSVRKIVFGKGTTRAEEFWDKELPPNAASSLACALCGVKKDLTK